ncbi:hypothetical protein AV540_09995 [Brevibacillus parabrevis]|nr:hypothetical protein AV540_09995 [Brevibacillus parabrevis]HBZ79261.1 hypothetical protein [Brevibacillus sp.]
MYNTLNVVIFVLMATAGTISGNLIIIRKWSDPLKLKSFSLIFALSFDSFFLQQLVSVEREKSIVKEHS